MTKNWDEYHRVEKRALNLFERLGYKVFDINKTMERPARNSEHEVLLLDNLKKGIKRINPWISENNLNKAVNMIRPARIKATNLLEANEIIYERLVKHVSVLQDLGQGKKNQTVKYIDFEDPDNNEFLVMNQYKVKGRENIIPDIVVFINGIPIGVIECKVDTIDEPEEKAIEQLRRYQNIREYDLEEGAEQLFYTNQVLVAAWKDSASASTIGAPARQFKAWKDPYPSTIDNITKLVGEEPTMQDILLYSMFKKERLLDLIQNFIVFEREGNGIVKKLARYQQYRAVCKAVERIKNARKLTERSGTVWHTQGSGKSLTMLFLALKLRRMKELENPTLLIVTDRRDLDEQITGTFKKCGFPNPIRAKSVKDLKEKLRLDAGKTIMTTVQKFQERDNDKYPVLSEDTNIFVMVDEAHRTQYKDLAANMRRALPNACYLGFTGTPIDKKARSTIRTFGTYIDTYTIEESVEDGATLPIFYEARLADLRVEGRDLDKLFDRIFKDYTDEEKQKIKEKHATEKDIAEASSRIEKICLDIIEHYESKIYPFKAQIVTVSREAAAKYKETLDNLNGPESAVIISGDRTDKGLIKKYITTGDERKELIKRFKDYHDSLKFLIVCDMLLTGFDAPVEQVMYLDKPLKEYNLLQAIARVNRRYDNKNFGLVVDYYGVFDHLKEALEIFNKKDIENAVTPVKDEKPRLERNYRGVMRLFDGVNMDNLDQCILAFKEEDQRIKFKNAFKAFARSMDIIMPDPIADPYREDLKKLGKIYKAVRNHYRDKNLNIKGVGDKVKKLIDKHIMATDIKILSEPVSILDEEKFEETINEIRNKETRASEMEHAIRNEISIKIDENPAYYQSLKERLEELIERRKQGMLDFAEQIEEMKEIINDIRNVRSKAERLGLNEKEFALYELLVDELEPYYTEEVADPPVKYNAGKQSRTDIKINEKVKNLAQSLINELEDMAVFEWYKKEIVLKNMRRKIKLSLAGYKEFRNKLDSLTTKIIKLARNILMMML
ncbi:type I restriction endonuclease subunit R [Halothermothrix orenii]|uniref:Type I restriction enzyme endonuclease subunit n=1 Tax=Halothermothrix orenii (strain H 168 / OCM 544 / DSM 9562) TaxID=373903 RepID=B8D1X7_HALOH|nr:type I restriction endonuclease subunit R [Halothermothrix orenii]ACL69204.1 type I site-specific deoxyribonuclease, HsdR family [Halothermothrix orenii H 168]